MRIVILASKDIHFLGPFIRKLIKLLGPELVAVYTSDAAISKARNQSRARYALALMLILGPWFFCKVVGRKAIHTLFRLALGKDHPLTILGAAKRQGIPARNVADVKAPEFQAELEALEPDVVINQANVVIPWRLIAVARLGWLNRHGSLLPKYKGRLAPFWAYVHGEKEIGVSIHFLTEEVDSGPILVQKHIPIRRWNSLAGLLRKVFRASPQAMAEALDLLRTPDYERNLLPNSPGGPYYPSPKPSDAAAYWRMRIRRLLRG